MLSCVGAFVWCGECYPQVVLVVSSSSPAFKGGRLVVVWTSSDLGEEGTLIKGSTLCERLALVPSSSFRLLCSHTTVLSCANPAFTNILYFFGAHILAERLSEVNVFALFVDVFVGAFCAPVACFDVPVVVWFFA